MTLIAIAECDLVVVTSETLSITRMVGHGNQPLLLSLKQLFAGRRQARMAFPARVALGSVHTVVKGNCPLPSTTVIECLNVSTNRSPVKEA